MMCPRCGLIDSELSFRRHLTDHEYHETDYDASRYRCPSCGADIKLILVEGKESNG